jgi:phosphoglycerate dehydrogenase-like enzyme
MNQPIFAEGPAIYVGSSESPRIWDAVKAGGGQPTTDITTATAAIWTGGPVAELASGFHSGIEWLQLPSAGVEQYASSGLLKGSHITTNAGPAYAGTVAEHTVALLLACARRIFQLSRQNSWSVPDVGQLRGSSVAIIGCGRIGGALITLLEPFDVEILASTRSGKAVARASMTVTPDRHPEILAAADFVVVAAPATPETAHIIGAVELDTMKPSAYLVNISRGSLVDTNALVHAVRTGQIAGAALDVTEPEPLPDDHPIWEIDEILITPHIANPDAWDAVQLSPLIHTNVERYLAGEPLLGLVDPDLGY